MSSIYKITNNINNKVYIGKTDRTIEQRFKEHKDSCNKNNNNNRPLYNAFKKYGIHNFQIEEIEQCNPWESSEREIYWIEKYNSYYNGYNATLGGDGVRKIDPKKVIEKYRKIKNQKEVAKIFDVEEHCIHKILLAAKEPILSTGEVSKLRQNKKVCMIDKETKKILKIFDSRKEAANWIKETNNLNSKTQSIAANIGKCANGIKPSMYGYIWSDSMDDDLKEYFESM